MFFLKFIFIIFIIAFLIIIGITIYNKIQNPNATFIESIPFIDDFKQNSESGISTHNIQSDINPIKMDDDTADMIKTDVISETNTAKKMDSEKSTKVETDDDENIVKTADVKKPIKKQTPTKNKAQNSAKKPVKKSTKSTAKKGDNIKKVNGIGPVFEKKLNAIGINSFEQIANWDADELAKIDDELNLSGRPQREDWVAKAKILLAEKTQNS